MKSIKYTSTEKHEDRMAAGVVINSYYDTGRKQLHMTVRQLNGTRVAEVIKKDFEGQTGGKNIAQYITPGKMINMHLTKSKVNIYEDGRKYYQYYTNRIQLGDTIPKKNSK